jgi:hypothetical protein
MIESSQSATGNEGFVERFSIQEFLEVLVVGLEELLTNIGRGDTGSNGGNGCEMSELRPSSVRCFPIVEPLQRAEMWMVPLRGHIVEPIVCTPCSSIVGVDSTAVPAMCHHIEVFTGGLSGTVDETGRTDEEGMEKANGVGGLTICHNEWEDSPNVGVQIELDTKVVCPGSHETGGATEHDESRVILIALDLDRFVEW